MSGDEGGLMVDGRHRFFREAARTAGACGANGRSSGGIPAGQAGGRYPGIGCGKFEQETNWVVCAYRRGRAARLVLELFFSLPNVETFLPVFIGGDQLRGIFCIIDIDRYVELDALPLPVFDDNSHRAVRIDVISAAYREIRDRSRSPRRAVTAVANIPPHLKTAKRNRFVFLPIMPNTLHQTEGFRRLGEVRRRASERSIPVVVDGHRRPNEQHGHWYGH
jgi:hypothetical protein